MPLYICEYVTVLVPSSNLLPPSKKSQLHIRIYMFRFIILWCITFLYEVSFLWRKYLALVIIYSSHQAIAAKLKENDGGSYYAQFDTNESSCQTCATAIFLWLYSKQMFRPPIIVIWYGHKQSYCVTVLSTSSFSRIFTIAAWQLLIVTTCTVRLHQQTEY